MVRQGAHNLSRIVGTLNDSQKRYTLSVLAGINRHLEEIVELLRVHPALFGELRNDVTAAEAAAFQSFASELRAEIRDLDRTFHLQRPQEPLSVRWGVVTHLHFADVELQELSRAKLAGYGALDDQVYRNLKAHIEKLRELIGAQVKSLGMDVVADG